LWTPVGPLSCWTCVAVRGTLVVCLTVCTTSRPRLGRCAGRGAWRARNLRRTWHAWYVTGPGSPSPSRFRDRPTGDILVLLIAGTVCFGVLASGAVIATVSILHPETDVSSWIARVSAILNTMVGLLAGFLAGRHSLETR
jgi:hypothetical protein